MFKNAIKTDILILYHTKMASINKNGLIILLFILILGAFFRFWLITEIPPGLYPDEAMNGNNALEAIATGNFKTFYPENNGREGLFINLQALSIRLFGNEPWALRVVSALFGTLTILGAYLLAKELFREKSQITNHKLQIISLLSSFFLATSYWHINFSRIGFRAIMVPFFSVFGLYFLLKGLYGGKIFDIIWAGIFIGLGFYTYIAFRFMPFVLATPIFWYLWQWRKENQNYGLKSRTCPPCTALLFLFVIFVAVLPIGLYFLQNPQDFIGRVESVSIFSAESPIKEFAISNLKTIGMFFVQGDCNWRHNFNCQPELNLLVSALFLAGTAMMLYGLVRRSAEYGLPAATLLSWLFFMSLPATLTREGLPHALRSIGMLPPVMILSGFGAWKIHQKTIGLLDQQKEKWPAYESRLERIKKEVVTLEILLLVLIPVLAYRDYFVRWASDPRTYFSFSTGLLHLGQFLKNIPPDIEKYVITTDPVSVQTVKFLTGTFSRTEEMKNNFLYVSKKEWEAALKAPEKKTVVAFIDSEDKKLVNSIQKKFLEFKIKAPGDFVILQNY